MPIYEFYCPVCHTVFSFLSRSMQNTKVPECPKCGRKKLEKKISRFAISKGLKESDATKDPFENVDEAKMEQLMMEMAPHLDENSEGPEDPRQMAALMKKMFDVTGMQPNEPMLEAIRRMEAGEDPDRIDEEMGDALDGEGDPFVGADSKTKKWKRMFEAPDVDPELYDM
ncbi:Zinc ribbon domain protein [Pirellula sp. SH-Sr6A]|uniref:FmdB family zinc ribbon protein n=1 Tax=Pirellula sp. SH-Sr6A TaxID=1632865 RepID=UPI00078C6CB1|nr:zinc ribbon domain-containing protein [Pirellula sp. SH-Sr6A]AMV33347.1 Zinc ribbon domain protein [Pirellula sp. SH-Sr6A]